MKAEIKERIEDINKGIVPKGYKTSKLGVIPEDWDVKHFEDVAVINPSKENLDENEIVSFVTMSDVSDDAKLIRYQPKLYKEVSNGFTAFKDRDVLVAKITPCFENGKGALVDNLINKTGFGSTEFHVLRPKKYGDEVYIYYHTITDRFRKIGEKNMTGTAGQKRISADFVKGFLIPYPRNDIERKKIADILSTWDKAIELKEKLIEQKKEQKKGLMQRLLTGKVRLPGFKGDWQKSKLGKHIKEWADGGTPPKNKKEYFGGNINWVVIDDIQRYIYTTKQTLTEEGLLKCSSKYWPEGTVILSTGATIGLVGIAKVKTATKQGITGIVTNETLYNEYLRYWLLNNRDLLLRYAQGSSIKEIRTNTLSKLDILLPSLEEQVAISKVLITFENQIELLQRELRELQLQKKGLMQLLLTGKVRVKC